MSTLPRRRALAHGLAAAGALAGAGLLAGTARAADVDEAADERLMLAAIAREREAQAAYRSLALRVPAGPDRRLIRLLEAHARLHSEALETVLGERGAEVRDPPAGRAAAGSRLGRDSALRRALTLEADLLSAHLDAIGEITSATLARALAGVAASAGQHLTVIRSALGRVEVPVAFEAAPPP